ncbi:NAD(P)/FAD-dependent oxidoreductase [Paenibacillus aceris]|uniref:3-phenylpropionate/trans-cinnamate dioxygenase ferredoxin reductase subunit n=1 Tax=Paenibacillus aceris TaxID=869555 RepID=A0ABS4I1W0_9BACL|nr:FAD-dependent oxidoreductase [Paenibacillus aceris]MBP1964903.1 3-phenylpropionate/trans-cinnamate dioxygenase ferredoxin reductase subunit [Paenibacillus aceris]NHW38149.1 FAD-dependent oxidoreductase [Paenibacillus aceris]
MADLGMVIVGAGEAGARAAVELRTEGWSGPITLIGKERLAPYERPPLSKSSLVDEEEPTPKTILDEAKQSQFNIQLITDSTVVKIDRDQHVTELSNGQQLRYERLLLATGAYPRRLKMEGSDNTDFLYLRTFADSLVLRSRFQSGKHIAVIGAGFIGLEVAASAREKGCSVTVIEVGPRILMRGVPEEIANIVEVRHRKAGVEFKLGVGIGHIDKTEDGHSITLVDGTVIHCNTVVVGIGAIPETSLAAQSGLTVDNGIWVDERLVTSDSDIFAAGDCCSFPHSLFGGKRIRLEAWRNAQDQGTLAAHNMLGASKPYLDIPWFWSDQYDQTLQVTGLPDCGVKTVVRNLSESDKFFFHLSDKGHLVAASAVGLNSKIAKEIRLAEMLIHKQAVLDPKALENPDVKLKALLNS